MYLLYGVYMIFLSFFFLLQDTGGKNDFYVLIPKW